MAIDHLKEAITVNEYVIANRRWFHRHPESSTKEFNTTTKIRDELKALGIPYAEVSDNGTVGIIKGGNPGPVIALRADIDALEITEQTGLDFASETTGLMHACGHDAHTACLLGAAAVLLDHRDELKGTVKLIFQPAEEIGKGAEKIIESGLLSDVEVIFGIHNAPDLEAGAISISPGPVSAGANTLKIELDGKSGHAATPDKTADVIAAGAAIVEGLQQFVSRELDPTKPAVISVCRFNAGTRDNIIAAHADISGTVRVADSETREQAKEAVHRIVENIAAAHRVKANVECEYVTNFVLNDEKLYPIVSEAATKIKGAVIVPEPVSMVTEDFGEYSRVAPSFFARVGVGKGSPLHSDTYCPDENAFPYITALHTAFVETYGNR